MSARYLYEAKYDLSSGHKFVLLFKEGDIFLPVPSCSTNPNWAVCVDMKGNIGFVPYTYVNKKQVSREELVWFIDDALQKLHSDSPSISKLTRDVISALTQTRSELNNEVSEEACESLPPPKEYNDEIIANHNSSEQLNNEDAVINTTTDEPNQNHQLSDASLPNSDSSSIENTCYINTVIHASDSSTQTERTSKISVPIWLVPTLIENIRCNTSLSHENSKSAIGVILNTFSDALPQLSTVWCELKENLKRSEIIQENPENTVQSEDKRKLLDIFKQLWSCKNDEQQRSWPVHEDEEIIYSLLDNMNNILLDANPRITREVIQSDQYEMVNLLVTYYQMEPRRKLRVKMLHIFLTLCELDRIVITFILNSVLPMELARDIQDNFEDEEKVEYSTYLLTVTFSTGEQPPRGTYDFINKKFLNFLFEKLEECVREGEEDKGQNLLNIILAFNLHFQEGQENIILETLKERHSAQALTEKLVFLLNREEDPSQIITHDVDVPNSILKFMVDMFSVPPLIELFYLNDIKVLVDIIVRQLSDLLPGEKKRMEYLKLIQNLLRNSNYDEHMHQIDGLKKCFHTVLSHEVPEEGEVAIIRNLMNEFQTWFSEE